MWESLIPIAGSLLGGMFGSNAAEDAMKAQMEFAQKQLDMAEKARKQTRVDMQPFYIPGVDSQNALAFNLGFGSTAPMVGGQMPEIKHLGFNVYDVGGERIKGWDAAMRYAQDNRVGQEAYQSPVKAPYELTLEDFEASPGYQHRLNEGLDAIQSTTARRHGALSPATHLAMNEYAQDVASNEYGNFYGRRSGEYNNYMNRLAGMANTGQNAAAGMAGANSLASNQAINAYGNMGNAAAAGAIGQGNARANALATGIGGWQYNNLLKAMA